MSLSLPGQLSADAAQVPPGYANQWFNALNYQTDCYTTLQMWDVPVASDGGGNLATVFGNSPSNTSNWSNLAAVFDEYRVLAMRIKFSPTKQVGGSSTISFAPILSVIDYDSSTAFTSYVQGLFYSSAKEVPGQTAFEKTAYMSGVENSQFLSTGAPNTTWYIKLYSSGNTASTQLGRFRVIYVIQFRGKGI